MRTARRVLRVLFYLTVVVIAAAVGALVVLTTTEGGRDNLAGMISSMASSDDRKITVGKLEGIWSGQLRIGAVAIADREGPWLVVRDVAVDWSPAALLSKTFRAERVAAGRIEVARLPVSSGQSSNDSGGTLPVAVEINQIDLPDIALGEALAGAGIAELAAKGSLHADPSPLAIAGDIAVERRDGKEGSVTGTIRFAPTENLLDLDLRAAEPAGGIIANLLRLPGSPAVDIAAKGSGPLSDWSGTSTFRVGGQVAAQLTGRHQLTDTGNRIEVKGDGEFEQFLPELLKPILKGGADFDIAGTATTGGGFEIERAAIDSESVHVSASGVFDPQTAADIRLEVTAKQGPVVLSLPTGGPPVTLAFDRLSARAFGDGREPMVDVTGSLVSVVTGGTEARGLAVQLHSDGFDVTNRTGPLKISLAADLLKTDVATLAPLVAGRVSADLAGTVGRDEVTLDEGTLRSDALDASLTAKLALSDLAMTLTMRADAVSTALPAQLRPVLGPRVQFSATATRDPKGDFAANAIELKSGSLSASGTASASGTDIRADLKGRMDDVSVLSYLTGAGLAGGIDFALTASGARTAPDFSISATSDKLTAAGKAVSNLRLAASGKADIASPTADISLTGTVDGQALVLTANLSNADGRRTVDGLSLALGDSRVSGDLVLNEAFLPVGTLALAIPDIEPLAALAGQAASGDIHGTFAFSAEGGAPALTVRMQSKSIGHGELMVRNIDVDAVIDDFVRSPVLSGSIKAASLGAGSTQVDGIAVDLTRDGEWTGFSGGASVNGIPAKASGRVRIAGGETVVELASGEAVFRSIRASIAQPSTVSVRDGITTLDKLVVGIGGGTATVTGTAGPALDLNVALSGVPLAPVNNFSPGVDLAGSVSGTVAVTGQANAPAITYDVKGTGIVLSQTRSAGFGGLGIESSGKFAGNKLDFTANVSEGSGVNLKATGSATTAGVPRVDIRATGGVPFAFLAPKLAAQGLSLRGTADVDVAVRGVASSPEITGSVRTTGARLIDSESGLAVNDITADVQLGGGVATINRLTGSLSTRGALTVGGTVGIDPASGFPADISIKLDNGRYMDGRTVTANLSGSLAIKGPLATAPAISGKVDLGRTVITVPERLPGSLSVLNVKHKNAPASVREQARALNPSTDGGASGGGGKLSLDITVNAPNQIFIQGRGVDAELGGNIRLTGPASAPQAVGEFTLQRGRLSILAKRLTFTEGTATFSGSLVPYINLVAETTAGDATVRVTVSGEATNPRFAFSSVPALPEDEILARLIFGRSMSNLSPLQIAQLAEAAAQLGGVGGSTSLLERLRGQLGIDDLDVTTDEQGGAAISAGKYLNDRTYLSIQKGEKPGSGRARIDFNVGSGIKLRGEASEGGEAKGGIFYEHEY